FREALFELEGHQRFGNFAAQGALVGQEEGSRDLHGDGAGALVVIAAMAEIGPGGTSDADEVKAAMLEEALVLGGDDGVDQYGRNVFVTDGATLFAGAVEQIGDGFRLDFGGAHFGAATEGANRADGLAGELHG